MELKNGKYMLQGVDVLRICGRFGTPLYVYDAQAIAVQIKALRDAFAGHNVKIKYAAKALTNLSVLKYIYRQGCGIDAVSIYEAKMALLVGFDPKDIVFTPSCVSFDEIVAGVEEKLVINLDSLPVLEQFGRRYGDTYPCCIRLMPNILAGGNHKIATGHSNSKFGIALYQLPQALDIVKKYGIRVEGLHAHIGSEIPDHGAFFDVAKILFGAAERFPALRFIDLGGGFKVPTKTGEKGTDIRTLGLGLGNMLGKFYKDYGRKVELWLEPGKYLVSEAGYFFVTTNVVKPTSSATFVGVNSGLNHFVRPMMYGSYHEIVNITNPTGMPKLYTVVGNICETDTFGAGREIAEIREGDILVIKSAGAYGYAMASNFNSRLRPAEVMIVDGKVKLVRKRDVFEDLLRGQPLVE